METKGKLKLWTPDDVADYISRPRSWVIRQTRIGKIPKVLNTGKSNRYEPEIIQSLFSTQSSTSSLKTTNRRKGQKVSHNIKKETDLWE